MPYEMLPSANTGRYEMLPPEPAPASPSFLSDPIGYAKADLKAIPGNLGNMLAGGVKGASQIGATLLAPYDIAKDALAGKGLTLDSNRQRRADVSGALTSFGADPNSIQFKTGQLGAEIAGTAGAGGAMANGVRGLAATRAMSGLEPVLNGIASGLETGGFRVGDMAGSGLGSLATRVGTGAITGGVTAGMVNPEDAGKGAMIGGALPAATQLAGATGSAIRSAIAPSTSPEVRDLAQKAADLGIKIPADRLVDSKPLNAVAASLNYVPLSGRAGTEAAMNSQLNQALSRTFGQDSSNVTMALRKAESDLGGKFEATLKGNNVGVDQQLLTDLADTYNNASRELGADALKPIASQIDEIISKGASGQIDGQAAYNIKRTLDRIGSQNTPTAWHAIELKKALMGALDRSLGPEQAAAFAQTRQQYGNMLDLQKLATNGVDGEISVARLANMKGIDNPQLKDVADIAAQFVKPREGAHGAAQRVFGASGAGASALAAYAGIPYALPAAVMAGGVMGTARGANSLLNSQMARNFVLGPGTSALTDTAPLGLLSRAALTAPVLAGSR